MIIGLVGASIEYVADGTAHSFSAGWFRVHYQEDMVSGLLFFAGGYLLARCHDLAMRKRTEQMMYLNHHCRNALQAITLTQANVADPVLRKQKVEESVGRVVATLVQVSNEEKMTIETLLGKQSHC
ncbi:MAG TPA: hypothetical protein VF493_12020 [Terriglobales bacterium]